MRRLVPLIVLIVLLAPLPAAAKEQSVEVCGGSGCVNVPDRGDAGLLHSTGARGAAPDPAPFYVVRFHAGPTSRAPIAWSYLYVPSASAIRGNEFGSGSVRWMQATFLGPLVADLTDELEPYPASPTWTPSTPAEEPGFAVGGPRSSRSRQSPPERSRCWAAAGCARKAPASGEWPGRPPLRAARHRSERAGAAFRVARRPRVGRFR